MAKGWESKSVEEQVSEKESESMSAEERAHRKHAVEVKRQREKLALELQQARILNERTSNVNRRTALQAALADVEEKLKAYS